MIIFVNEDRAFAAWRTHHRQGFVLDGRRNSKGVIATLHRATCGDLKTSAGARSHGAIGRRFKACSLVERELSQWADQEHHCKLLRCPTCQPESTPGTDSRLTRLGRDILDFVIESAAIHFEWPDASPYHVTVGNVAHCMRKSPTQVSTALHALIRVGLIAVSGRYSSTSVLPVDTTIEPTVAAMRTLSALADMSDEEIQGRLDQLVCGTNSLSRPPSHLVPTQAPSDGSPNGLAPNGPSSSPSDGR